MPNRRSPILTLVRLDLRRTARPFLLSLTPLALVTVLGLLANPSGTNVIAQLIMPVSVGLPMLVVSQQVAKDRQSGILDYFATLPVSGLELVAVRLVTLVIYVAGGFLIALTAGLGTATIPAATLPLSHQLIVLSSSFAVVCCVGMILISLLARYSFAVVIGAPLVGFVVLATLLRVFPLPLDAQFLRPLLSDPSLLILGGIVLIAFLFLGAAVAAAAAARVLQPLSAPAGSITRLVQFRHYPVTSAPPEAPDVPQ